MAKHRHIEIELDEIEFDRVRLAAESRNESVSEFAMFAIDGMLAKTDRSNLQRGLVRTLKFAPRMDVGSAESLKCAIDDAHRSSSN